MTRIITGIAALLIAGAAAMPLPASAAENGLTNVQSTELSSQRYWRHHHRYYGHRYWGPRRHWGYWGHRRYWGPRFGYRHWGPRYYGYRHRGPRYGYYPHRYRHYGYYGYPYRRPGLVFGLGPTGFRVF